MFLSLVRKEITYQIISAKFVIMTLLVVVLALVSVMVMHRDYQIRLDNYNRLKPDGSQAIAIKEPAPLSVLVKGVDDNMGRAMSFGFRGDIIVGSSQSGAVRLFALFRELDIHFVILAVMSLAAILFSFDMISREKRGGTLKYILSNSVSRARILMAKGVSALLLVTISMVTALLIALIYMHIEGVAHLGGEFYLRVALLAAVTLVYIAVFVGIGLLISSLTHRPAVSLILSMLVWAMLVFVLPNALSMLGRTLEGGDSPDRFQSEGDAIYARQHFLVEQQSISPSERREILSSLPKKIADNYRASVNQARERVELVKALGSISPASSFSFAAWGLAGTGPDDSLAYKEEILRYQPGASKDAEMLWSMDRGFEGAPEEYEAEIFSAEPRTLSQVASNDLAPSFSSLGLTAIVLFAVTFFVFARYDVR